MRDDVIDYEAALIAEWEESNKKPEPGVRLRIVDTYNEREID